MTLTGKQARFVAEYVNSLNGTQAAIAAGYSVKTARAIASENLGKPSVKAEIAHQQALRQERLNATRELVIQELVKIVDFEISALFDKNNCLLPMPQWPREAASVVDSLKYGAVNRRTGRARASIKFTNRLKFLKLLGDLTASFPRKKYAKRRNAKKR